MLPTLTSRDIEEGMRSYIEREFPVATTAFRPEGRSIVEHFLENPENLVKGPWLEIRRPFRKSDGVLADFLPVLAGELGVLSGFEPHRHQARAFERLVYPNPRSTIVATGTGSGKTECFLLPVLDAVLAMKKDGIEGIKAIVVYPMNALATDQAKRLAELCHAVRQAGGPGITAGLYTGAPGNVCRTMEENSCITDRETLRRTPPDILLTNYKMLDYLLLREEDRALWRTTTARSLRYLVVDELHTFDGAQGTDLACLIRRLRDRLDLGEGLACVGTSATLGGGDGLERLQQYASDVFGADFSSPESVITEDRLGTVEYLESFGEAKWAGDWPTLYEAKRLATAPRSGSVENFISLSIRTWLGKNVMLRAGDATTWTQTALMLSDLLPHHPAFRRLMSEADGILHLKTVARNWQRDVAAFRGLTTEEVLLLLRSFVALVSMARLTRADGKLVPFLSVRVQLWVRELAQMLATVERTPKLIPMADVKPETPPALPVLTCRACNATAWGAVVADGELQGGARNFYRAWFSKKDVNAKLLYPVEKSEFATVRRRHPGELMRLCPAKGVLVWVHDTDPESVYAPKCPVCEKEHDAVIVRVPKIHTSGTSADGRYVRLQTNCALCGATNSMRILGARSVTMSSALTGHLHSSSANDDHKLINFTDAVQDAAHRAGFMEARSFIFVLRQAVAGLLRDSEGEGLDFESFLAKISDFWLEHTGGRRALENSDSPALVEAAERIAAARFVSAFIPSSMLWRRAWTDFRAEIAAYYREQTTRPVNTLEAQLGRIPPLDDETEEGRRWKRLFVDVSRRLRWEAFVEMTMRVHSGRTVESLGIGAVEPDPFLVDEAAARLECVLSERCPSLRGIDLKRCRLFVEGFLMHQKLRGAFDVRLPDGNEGADDFMRFVRTGSQYWFSLSLYLPSYGPNYRPPAPLVFKKPASPALPFFDAVLPKDERSENWYTLWLARTLGEDLEVTHARGDIYRALLDILVESNAVTATTMSEKTGSLDVYLLNPRTWLVKRRLARAVCQQCGRSHVIDADRATFWSAMPCLSQGCMEKRHEVTMLTDDDVTYRGAPVRVTAREHTGNLEHQERGTIEKSFIEGREPWDVNLLCATPTLEMGIDIGDLSTVLLSSMPPGPANYVQRIGRAGRRDGNALAMTVCDTGPHAQYFWAAPEKMLEAEVNPPGVFLHAPAVLERQLFAFAITRWMSATPEAKIPDAIGEVLRGFEAADPAGATDGTGYSDSNFPFGLLDFVKTNAEVLLADFAALFTKPGQTGTIFSAEERARLLAFLVDTSVDTPSVRTRLLGKIRRLLAEKKGYEKKRESYQAAVKRLKKGPIDEHTERTIEELKANIDALLELCREEFREKKTLNVLTDEGVLPNYAFPEEGIGLDGLVMRVRDRRPPETREETAREAMLAAEREASVEGDESRSEEPSESSAPSASSSSAKSAARTKKKGVYKRFNFRRAASTGLFELAPGNTYYANEFVLHIDQVDLADDKVAWWRFCPVCNHSALDRPEEKTSACPRCGSPAWQEVGQSRPVLQLRNVYAYADIRKDRIADDREDRKHVEQSRIKLIDIDPRVERRSFVLPESDGFGFEYIPSVTFRDFNFGRYGQGTGEAFEVASQKIEAPGFRVCKHCGRLAKEVRRNEKGEEFKVGREEHDFSCPAAKDPAKAEWIEGLVLSRSFASEALRIRVPQGILTETHSPATVTASLVAALRLGLRQYFHGSVDHLKVTPFDEPAEGGRKRVHYIVVYDTVPGGTGYLKELMANEKNLIDVFRSALSAMSECPCGEDPTADGCYRCVYAHGDASGRSEISRSCAIETVSEVIAKAADLKPGSIDLSGGNSPFDSELERLFIGALRLAKPAIESVKRIPTGNGLWHYMLRTNTGRLWRVEPQEDVSGECPSRPDFLFRPVRESDRRPDRTMAVFLDGWAYHADILAEDFAKRQSLMNRGMRVWTLGWNDVAPRAMPDADFAPGPSLPALATLSPRHPVYLRWRAAQKQLTGRDFPEWTEVAETWATQADAFDRLIAWLADPQKAEDCAKAANFAMLVSVQTKALDPADPQALLRRAKRASDALCASDLIDASEAQPPQWLDGTLDSPDDVPFRRTYRRLTGANGAILCANPGALSGVCDTRASGVFEASVRALWSEAGSLQFSNELVLLPALPEVRGGEGGAPDACASRAPWAKALDRLRGKVVAESESEAALRALQASFTEALKAQEEGASDVSDVTDASDALASPSSPDSESSANSASARANRLWASVLDLLPEELLPLAGALASRAVAIDEKDVGVDLVDPALGEVVATAELYWKEAALAVVLDEAEAPTETRRAGVRCVNGSAPLERVLEIILAHPGLPKVE